MGFSSSNWVFYCLFSSTTAKVYPGNDEPVFGNLTLSANKHKIRSLSKKVEAVMYHT